MAAAKLNKAGGVTLKLSLDEAQWVSDVLLNVSTIAGSDPVWMALEDLPSIRDRIAYHPEPRMTVDAPDGRAS